MSQHPSTRGPMILGAIAVSYFVFWACAPPSVVAPMTPMADPRGWDLGGSLSAGGSMRTVGVYDSGPGETGGIEYELVDERREVAQTYGGQVWGVYDAGRVAIGGTLGAAAVLDEGGGVHGGVMVRPTLLERDDLMVGLDVQLGWLWGSLGVPISVRATDRVWVYTDPSLGLRYTGLVNVPLGVSIEVAEKVRFNAEVDVWAGQELLDMGYLDGATVLGTVGVSYRP